MSRNIAWSGLVLAILIGFFLRLHHLDTVPLRGDEAFNTVYWAGTPLSQSLVNIIAIEPFPPLGYVIFRAWNHWISGIDSVFALRMLTVLGNLVGIPAIYALGFRLMRNRTIGLTAAWMWAFHPYEIWLSQDFRIYAVWASLSLIVLWSGIRLLTHRRRVDWLLFATFATLTAFTFYTELLTLTVLGIFALFTQRQDKRFLARFLGIQIAIALSNSVIFVVKQGSLIGGGGYSGNVETFSAGDWFTRFIPTLTLGDMYPAELQGIWLILLMIIVLFAAIIFYRTRQTAFLLIVLIVVPLLLLGIASLRLSIFHPRYVISTIPAFLLFWSMGTVYLGNMLKLRWKIPQFIVWTLFIGFWLAIAIISLQNYFTNPLMRKAVAWDELGDFLNTNVSENDLVIQLSTDAAFGYYYKGQARDIGLPEKPSQASEEIIADLEAYQYKYDSIYIVSNAIPDWQNADVVETWANEHMQLVRYSNASGLGIRQYKNWEIASLPDELLTSFDNTVELLDYQLFETPLPTGEIVLWLYWRPIKNTEVALKSFVHLVGDINPATGNPLWTQDDQFPQVGRLDSITWQIDTVYRDVYYLPVGDVSPDKYNIYIGWYDPDTGNRLFTTDNSDSYHLTDITIQ